MKFEIQKNSRARVLAVICIGLMVIFLFRLFYLQVIAHDKYVSLANQEQLKRLVLPAARGEIFAMDGDQPVKIVLNEPVYTLFIDPQIVKKPEVIIEKVKQVAGGNTTPEFEKLFANKQSRYQIIAKGISQKQAELLKKDNLSGLGFQKTTRRVYPEGGLAAQTLGFVNNEGLGQYGVEGMLNQRLAGKEGMLQTVTDVGDVPLTIGGNQINQPPKNGEDIVLSIDRNVQSYVEQALANGLSRTGATNASAIVMDPSTGKVLSMANLPTYKPEDFGQVKDGHVFSNPVVSAPYEPGSVMKTFTLATGINEGVITSSSTYNNTDYITVDDRTITNAAKGQTGIITMQHALNWSLNTGMVTVAKRLGDGNNINGQARETMYSYLHDKFGLSQMTGIEVSGEVPGIIIPPSSPEGNAVRYSNMSFGQGMDLTMIQVAAGFSAIINGGTYYHPTVINGVVDENGVLELKLPPKPPRQNIIKKSTSETMRQMIYDARSTFHGSNDKPGYYVGGKTGTTQTLRDGKYVFNETIGTYIGFGGSRESTKYVIMVQISGPNMKMEGNIHAMPIFTDISNWMLDYMKVAPKG